ncbi:hypothetical protein E8E12_009144 [Didymella heteroderae]|uniref:DUF7708 domain-containing protein n=1 Tax=Didymella heteroderae TaxID=1769908 RepID=A0A9P4WRL2_9PLEO|nr:hypothetical protein E8E12_009144 [Didymella heteroderae]
MKTNLQEDGLVLVRRFTDELKGETTLERAAISAQEQDNANEKALRRRRMEALYRDPGRDPSEFSLHEMEAARLALQKAYTQLERDEKPSTLAKHRFSRNTPSPRATANEAVVNAFAHDFKSLQAVVEKFETNWKGNQNNVGQRFRKVCQKLDDHKAAFAVFPSQDMYTSALCGSLALIVGAAVNHNDVADKLSDMVVEISEKATRAAKMVMIYPTKNFRELFSDLYAQVFLFYRDVILWYAKSKATKALDSFNANLIKPYEKAAARIESLVVEIFREADVAGAAKMSVFVEDYGERLLDQRRQYTDDDDLRFAGRQSQRLMLLMHETAYLESETSREPERLRIEPAKEEGSRIIENDVLDRASARELGEVLSHFVVGTEGPSLFRDGKFWLPEANISNKLGDWIGSDTELSTLWITSPIPSREFPGSRAGALVALVAAWESRLPIISHFCLRPYAGSLAKGRNVEQVGLIGLVYSLIIQLLQFNVKDDVFEVPKQRFDNMDGSYDSWPEALLLLRDLLRTTPQVQRCIIDGLNDLCFSSGAEWCGAFLGMLFEHQKASPYKFKILLTTTGLSRVLSDFVTIEDKVLVQRGAKEVIRGGKWLTAVGK